MDAQLLETQVLDLASQLLTTRLEPAAAAAVGDKLAPDAVLDTPGYRARGAAAVADALALHSHLSRGAVTASEWDDGEKQATISVKLSYALPAEQLPWPLSLARHLSLPLEYHHIRVQLAADASVPTSSEASAPSKYHVARVTVPQRKQPRLLRLAERVVLAFLAPLLPLAVWLGVVAMKFLHRHPLAEGLVRAGFAAVAEIVGFVWGAAGGLLHALLPAAPAKSAQIQDENTTNGTTTDVGASPTASPVRRASRLAVPTEAKESKKDKTESKDKAEPKPKAEAKPKPKSAAPKSAPAPATPAPKAAPAPSELAREEAAAEDNLAPPPLTKDEVRVAPAPAGAPSFAAAAAEAPGDRAARAEVADVAREEAAAEAGAAPHPLSKDEVVVPPAPAGAPSFAAAAAESAGSSPASASPPASVSDAPKKKKNKKKNHHTKSQL